MNLRQAVTLAILVGGPKALTFEPAYLMEKVRCIEMSVVPETILDETNQDTFDNYAMDYGLDWDRERDLQRPMSELREEQGW